MNLWLRQIWALIRKNLLLICVRRPFSTTFRAIILPLAVILIVAYSKYFFASPQTWGVSGAHSVRSFADGLKAVKDHDTVGFINHGPKDGAIASVITSLSKQVSNAGKSPKTFDSTTALAQDCRTSLKGDSPCFGAIVFFSSPKEGSNISAPGTWNYTILGEDSGWGGQANVNSDSNGIETHLIPFQRAVDLEINRQSNASSQGLPDTQLILFTDQDQEVLNASRTENFLILAIYAFGPLFVLTLIDVIYHMTTFVARERELGMSGLIDTMISGASSSRGRVVRQTATYLSFAAVYLPSWIAVGVVISAVIFPKQSRGLPTGFVILSGLAFTSFSLFGSSFFKKAQLSGSIMVVITFVGAVLPVVLFEQTQATCAILSVLFPSANMSYFLTGVAVFEYEGTPVNLNGFDLKQQGGMTDYRLPLYFHFVIALVHILILPALAFGMEHWNFSTASPHRVLKPVEDSREPTLVLSAFSKTYRPGVFARIFRRRKNVEAVKGMDLKAYPGQILVLLGPNGCGKSTTLNCISGDQKVTSGEIRIDSTGGLGYAPQKNVIWPELTVAEHMKIFSDLKCLLSVNAEVITELAKGVDLSKKLHSQAHSLSGGQKRKLQMAMMFAGGSAVCCVDEVSTGLDPISRRRIWEILLAERRKRTIIMTTHFLDEADYLADDIAIMYKGTLRASGTSASLKHTYGDGYTVKLPYQTDIQIPLSGQVSKESSRHQTVFRVATATLAAELAEQLDQRGLEDYQISGPTMEELFLKITGDKILPHETENSANVEEPMGSTKDLVSKSKEQYTTINITETGYELTEGRSISVVKQWWLLFCKRVRILRRRFIPYFVAVALAIVGAGVAPLLIKKFNTPIPCPTPADLISDYTNRVDLGTDYTGYYSYPGSDNRVYVFGPASKLNDQDIKSRLDAVVDVYSENHTLSYSPTYTRGYNSTTQLTEQFLLVDTYDEFSNAVQNNWKNQSRSSRYDLDGYSPYTTLKGGVWLGGENSKPTMMVNVRQIYSISQMISLFNALMGLEPTSVGYDKFASTHIPELIDFTPLMFIIYFGLIMSCYPVFFILYPTNERIYNVRSMQYSNGIRPIPLWLSHLAFDSMFILLVSVVVTALLYISTPVWTGLGYLFIILVLYGIDATLLSYIISMFTKGPVSAWFLTAIGQIILYFAYFGGIIGLQSSTAYPDLESTMNSFFFGMGIISPVVCLERALFIGLQQLAVMCNGRSLGSLQLYGGPILYLVLQGLFLFGLLLWWDSGFVMPALRQRKARPDSEAIELVSADMVAERKRLDKAQVDLRVESVSKSFGKNVAVDDVTFGVQRSEIFALLGPNGAGKSTIISMIRGDIKPSTSASSIEIAGHPIRTHAVAARANLGVCPQFDSADVLTVYETLRFFAKVRGVENVEHNVNTVIAACGIEAWRDQLAQKLSGGTKRKLSLAVALVGNPRVLVLDEPSSALDANAKRTLWRCLQTLSKDRAVVLTTHSMEEADALADRVGIVSSRMLALGDREELKRRAGDNFYIHVVSRSAPRTTTEELNKIKEVMYATFDGANISRETQGGQVRLEVPTMDWNMVKLIRAMESIKGDLGIEFYSVGRATLDEVFENIVRRYGDNEAIER